MLATAVSGIDGTVSEFLDFEKDLFDVFAVVENTTAENPNAADSVPMDAAVDDGTLINIDSLIVFQVQDADVMDTRPVIVNPCRVRRDGVVHGRVEKEMQRVVETVKLDRVTAGTGKGEGDCTVLHRRSYLCRQGTEGASRKGAARVVLKGDRSLPLQTRKIGDLALVGCTLMTWPAPVIGIGGDIALRDWQRQSVRGDGDGSGNFALRKLIDPHRRGAIACRR